MQLYIFEYVGIARTNFQSTKIVTDAGQCDLNMRTTSDHEFHVGNFMQLGDD